jgi:hypothetical protein
VARAAHLLVAMPAHEFSRQVPASATVPGAGFGLSFASPAGLRALLDRLHEAGDGAWRDDPDATALLAYTIDRYGPLARSWHRDPGEAASAAFMAMRHNGVRHAADPWAVVTRAVQVSLSAENHAERHLTSTEKARRTQHAEHDVPVRAGELTDTLPFATLGLDREPEAEPVIADATALLELLDWPQTMTGAVVEYIAGRLTDAGSIPAAYESLRRDTAIRAQLDLDRRAWAGLLRVLLGSRPQPGRPTRKGVLARLLLGETVRDLLDDNGLVRSVLACRPIYRAPLPPGDEFCE